MAENTSNKDLHTTNALATENLDEQPAQPELSEEERRYEQAMLAAYVQKPEKVAFYQAALDKATSTGEVKFQWHWSWWGFFGSWAFLLYRKSYIEAFVAFIITSIMGMLPLGDIVARIAMGGLSPYLIIKRFLKEKQQIEIRYDTNEDRIEAMRKQGGFNTWVAWVAFIVYAFLAFFVLSLMLGLNGHH